MCAVVTDEEWRDHIRSTLGDSSHLTFVGAAGELPVAVAHQTPDIVLWHLDCFIEPPDTYAVSFWQLRRIAPGSIVIAYGVVGRAAASGLLAAGRVGVDRLLLRGFDDLARGIREAFRLSRLDATIREAIAQLAISPGPAAVTVAHCLQRARAGSSTVQHIASELGVSRRTITRWFHACDLPALERVFGCCRVFWVAELLHDSQLPVTRVAHLLRYSSESDLRRMVARYAGCVPTQLRAVCPPPPFTLAHLLRPNGPR